MGTNDTPTLKQPPFDQELADYITLHSSELSNGIELETIGNFRMAFASSSKQDILDRGDLSSEDITITSYDGKAIELSVLRPAHAVSPFSAGIFFAHGGGMVLGDRWRGVEALLTPVLEHNAILVTVEYRTAPEHPDPTPLEDCYAGLAWMASHAEELGFDEKRLLIAGRSAGAGLAAGAALLARDRQGPPLAGQLLMAPMLDDRDTNLSTLQFDGIGPWDRVSNRTGWTALLGDRRGTADVSIYSAPGRAEDLSSLPPTFIDVGSADIFRDESVAYAQRIWSAGGSAELHIWAGGVHGFEGLVPDSLLAEDAPLPREGWLRRTLGRPTNNPKLVGLPYAKHHFSSTNSGL